MVRKLRIEYPGAMYHVMNRGDQREAIFKDDPDRQRFLSTLGEACEKTEWQVHAYCLMSNHEGLMEKRRAEEGAADYQELRRAWVLGSEDFRRELLAAAAERVGLSHYGAERHGTGVGIRPEVERVQRVGKKIVRGLIFHDAGAVVTADTLVVALLPTRDVPSTKVRDAAEPYWRALSSSACIHTMCGDHCAMRRIYIGHPSSDGIVLESHFAIMLWPLYFAASIVLPLDSVTKTDFAFAADTPTGEWIRSNSGDGQQECEVGRAPG